MQISNTVHEPYRFCIWRWIGGTRVSCPPSPRWRWFPCTSECLEASGPARSDCYCSAMIHVIILQCHDPCHHIAVPWSMSSYCSAIISVESCCHQRDCYCHWWCWLLLSCWRDVTGTLSFIRSWSNDHGRDLASSHVLDNLKCTHKCKELCLTMHDALAFMRLCVYAFMRGPYFPQPATPLVRGAACLTFPCCPKRPTYIHTYMQNFLLRTLTHSLQHIATQTQLG